MLEDFKLAKLMRAQHTCPTLINTWNKTSSTYFGTVLRLLIEGNFLLSNFLFACFCEINFKKKKSRWHYTHRNRRIPGNEQCTCAMVLNSFIKILELHKEWKLASWISPSMLYRQSQWKFFSQRPICINRNKRREQANFMSHITKCPKYSNIYIKNSVLLIGFPQCSAKSTKNLASYNGKGHEISLNNEAECGYDITYHEKSEPIR